MIERVILKGESASKVCREAGISRTLFYRWLKRYKEEGAVAPKKKAPKKPPVRKIRKISPWKKLSPKIRLEMIERVVKDEEPVAQVCRLFHVSRPAFYKWLKRYQKAAEEKKLEALVDQKPKVKRYYRQTPPKYEEAVLSVVAQFPQLGVKQIVEVLPRIADKPIVGYHGVQKILQRNDLNTYEKRLVYAQAQVTPVVRLIGTWEEVFAKLFALPVETRKAIVRFVSVGALTCFLTIVGLGGLGYFGILFGRAPTVGSRLGLIFASIALSVGSAFFLYSMKYYFTLALVLSFSREAGEEEEGNKRRKRNGLSNNIGDIELQRHPFVSIHLPFYNEKRVAKRILDACSKIDYPPSPARGRASVGAGPHFEIIVCDDSTDETVEIVQRFAQKHNAQRPKGPKIKVLHRPTREGFKGGALSFALKKMDPRTEFIIVFDADFIPYPDTIIQFLKYFQANGLDLSRKYTSEVKSHFAKASRDRSADTSEVKSKIACVAGYQWHVLNKSENWITRGVRSEYAGSYVIERPGREILGLMKQISGSVYMIRSDVLKKIGWETSITEDFQLTLKLYEQGYKVIYTPYVQAPAECVSTLKRLIRQRMRWAEGHSNNVRKMFLRLLKTPKMTLTEKLEFLYLSPYYLQAFFFLVGTLSWLMAETVFRARLPFWTSLWGWSLVLTNFFSLPLMNAVGLFLEESEERDYLGLLSFVILSYILVPFQAYASVKGFLEREEGPWFRTPKTGKITDIFKRGTFYRWIRGILPWRGSAGSPLAASLAAKEPAYAYLKSPYVARATANNRFNNFTIRPKRPCLAGRQVRWVSKAVLAILLCFSVSFFTLAHNVSVVLATNPSGTFNIHTDSSGVLTTTVSHQLKDAAADLGSCDTGQSAKHGKTVVGYIQIKPDIINNSTAASPCPSSATGTGWIFDTLFDVGGYIDSGAWNFYLYTSDNVATYTGYIRACVYRVQISGTALGTSTLFFTATGTTDVWVGGGLASQITTGATPCSGTDNHCEFTSTEKYLYVDFYISTNVADSAQAAISFGEENCGTSPYVRILTPTVQIPEKLVFLAAAAPFIPMAVMWMKKKREAMINV